MTWVKIDTRFPTHPKVLEVGPLAEALWLRALCYAGEHLTDGFVPRGFVCRMSDIDGEAEAEKLVESGLWWRENGGWRIHQYLDWQQSKSQAEDISAKRADAGRQGGKQRASNLLQANQAKPKQIRYRKEEDKSCSPLPPNPPANGAALEPNTTTSNNTTSSYLTILDGRVPQIVESFQAIDADLTASWFMRALAEIEADVGPLEGKQLVAGLSAAKRALKGRLKDVAGRGETIGAIRPYAKTFLRERLQEQADAIIP